MKQSVVLVQRGISSLTHPVSGKSGKAYGNAVQSVTHGGVVFKLSLEDYARDAHDLMGNTIAGQQWVPEFVTAPGPNSFGKCSSPACGLGSNGGAAEASYTASGNLFCAGHATTDAEPLYEGAPAKYRVAPVVVEHEVMVEPEPLSQGRGETMPPIFAGSAEEEASSTTASKIETPVPISFPKRADRTEPPTVFSDPGAEPPAPTPAVAAAVHEPVASVDAPAAPQPAPAKVKDLIETMVSEKVQEAVAPLKEQLSGIAEAIAALKPSKPGLQGRRQAKVATEFDKIRAKAKEMGIPIFQKSQAQLEAAIDAKSNGQSTPATPEVTESDIQF